MAFPALTSLFDRYLAMPPEGLIASPVFTDQTSLRAPSGRKPYLVAADSPISTSRFQTNRSRSGTSDSSNHTVLLSVILGGSSSLRAQWQAGGVDSAVEPRRV